LQLTYALTHPIASVTHAGGDCITVVVGWIAEAAAARNNCNNQSINQLMID
jgi:hypothetical protein